MDFDLVTLVTGMNHKDQPAGNCMPYKPTQLCVKSCPSPCMEKKSQGNKCPVLLYSLHYVLIQDSDPSRFVQVRVVLEKIGENKAGEKCDF